MRVFFILSENPLFKTSFLEQIIRKYSGKIVGITITPFRPCKMRMVKYFRFYIILLGLKGLYYVFSSVVHTKIMDIISRFLRTKRCYSIKGIGRRYKIPIYYTKNINDERFIDTIRNMNIDVIVSSGNQIFKKDILNLPRIGSINRHSSLLPYYRGIYPIFWEMLNGENHAGVSIHWITEEIDKGTILNQAKIKIEENDSFFSLYRKIFDLSSELVVQTLNDIENGTVKNIINNPAIGSYYSYPSRKDIKRFRALGKRIV